MGYYSDVGIVLTKESNTYILEHIEFDKIKQLLLDNIHGQNEENGEVFYLIEFVKWYTYRDTELRQLHDLILGLNEETFLYIILGEDFGDMKTYGSFYENSFEANVCTHIAYSNQGWNYVNARYARKRNK